MTKDDMIATVKNVVNYLYKDVGDTWYGDLLDDVLEELMNNDSVKHGHWIDVNEYHIGTCSACGDRWGSIDEMHYCPNCGAKMDLE